MTWRERHDPACPWERNCELCGPGDAEYERRERIAADRRPPLRVEPAPALAKKVAR